GVSFDDIALQIEERFDGICKSLDLDLGFMDEVNSWLRSLTPDISKEWLVSRGEYFTAKMMAAYLGFRFVDAADCILFSSDGELDKERTDVAVRSAYEQYGNIVIPGFYGSLPNNRVRLMPRGGSDITGAIVSAALGADIYENWTDVSGIFMADPRIVPEPKPIPTLTYDELRELSFMGATVLQEDSILPVTEAGIPLNIRNTNEPDNPGSLIVDKVLTEESDDDRFITGIAGRKNFTVLSLQKRKLKVSESLRKVLEILERFHIEAENITLGLDTFSVIVSSSSLENNEFEVIGEIRKTVQPDKLETQDGISLIAAVGRKMMFRPGISGRLFNALGENGINVRTIAQGADELSILVGVYNKDFDKAVRVLYESFART
ncbi:MAG: aspartate kinase, partial [Oscillospiraceae bacterium]|nr:aspartate kinase [Oscillospiraceae bacterium]